MCGLVGVFSSSILNGQPLQKSKTFISEALIVDTLRGGDGTGLVTMKRNTEDWHIAKLPIEAYFALSNNSFTKVLQDSDYGFMGHNRKSTRGSNTYANTHPFRHGDVILCHNGTLTNHHTLTQETFSVDSEAICNLIANNHPVQAIERLTGSYALSWFNTHFKTLSFARNEDRPLYIGKAKEMGLYFYASEFGLINWIAGRNGIVIESIKELPVGEIHTYHFTKPEKDWHSIETFTPKKFTAVTYDYSKHQHASAWRHNRAEFSDADYEDFYDSCAIGDERTSRGLLQASSSQNALPLSHEKSTSVIKSEKKIGTEEGNIYTRQRAMSKNVGARIKVIFTQFHRYSDHMVARLTQDSTNNQNRDDDVGVIFAKAADEDGLIETYIIKLERLPRYIFYNNASYAESDHPTVKIQSIDYINKTIVAKLVEEKLAECDLCGTDILNTNHYHLYSNSTLCEGCYRDFDKNS